jgi:hypothetical protein
MPDKAIASSGMTDVLWTSLEMGRHGMLRFGSTGVRAFDVKNVKPGFGFQVNWICKH